MSSSAQGELSALMRVHSPVAPKSTAFAISINPLRAASLASTGMASSRLPSTTSTCRTRSGHLGAHFLVVRRHEMNHALEPHRQFAQRRGRADGERSKELAWQLHRTFQKTALPFRAMQRPRQVADRSAVNDSTFSISPCLISGSSSLVLPAASSSKSLIQRWHG